MQVVLHSTLLSRLGPWVGGCFFWSPKILLTTFYSLRLHSDAVSQSHLEPKVLLWQNIWRVQEGLPWQWYHKTCVQMNFVTIWHLPAGEGWLGLEELHKVTTNTKGSYKLKVTLTDQDFKDYVGYWEWIKVFIICICLMGRFTLKWNSFLA